MNFINLQNIEIRPEYRSLRDNVINDFYIPALEQSNTYRRAVGFFSSTALVELSAGIEGLIANDGKIQLISSPRLSIEDIAAINNGLKRRNEIIEAALLRELREPENEFEAYRLNLLSNLIATGVLEIKIAFLETNNEIGMFHEKMGLLYDANENIIAFSGSMNESANAFTRNYESIDVYKSWTPEIERVLAKQAAFNAMWNDYEPNLHVAEFPIVAETIIKRFQNKGTTHGTLIKEGRDIFLLDDEQLEEKPSVPLHIELRDYQNKAVDAWANENYQGIFDMATGTGKTYTALAAIINLYKALGEKLAVIIVCPYQHLVEQWKDDIVAFGMKPILCYSASPQRQWRDRLKNSIAGFMNDVQDHFCIVATNAMFSTPFLREQVDKLKGNVVLVVDEAHNFGATHLSTTLKNHIPYRLALSATIDRHGDPEGTEKLYEYFGEKCIEYTLEDAIANGMLTPYYYHPVVVSLTENELGEYLELTQQARKASFSNNEQSLSEYAKMLFIKRARIVAGATMKIASLSELIKDYRDDSHMLVYCGATTMRDIDYKEDSAPTEEIRQVDLITDLLGNELSMRISKFTSEEDAAERKRIISDFDEGTHLQALVAIRCLDEGVNIPSIRTAFILASSTNPKEYIQRRGRVLRKFPGKDNATIFDFITLPIPLDRILHFDSDHIESSKSLAIKEIRRMKDFASIAENPFEVDSLIASIRRAYNISELDLEEGDIYD